MAISGNRSSRPEKAEENSGNCQEGLPWQGLDENGHISDFLRRWSGECQETHSGPWRFDLNGSWHSPQGSAALKKVSQLSDQNGLLPEEGAIQDNETFVMMNSAVSCPSQKTFSMLLRRLGVERAGRPHPHPGGLLEGVEEGAKNAAAVDFADALQRG
jgi:hypothetical protein